MQLFHFSRALLCTALAVGSMCAAETAGQKHPVLRKVVRIQSLTSDQANAGWPVDLHVQVTYIYTPWRMMFTRDNTGSLFMILPKIGPVLHQGDLIEVRGVTTAGSGGNIVTSPQYTVLGAAPLRHPRRLDLSRIHSAESEFVETEGILRPGPFIWSHASFLVTDGPTVIPMTIPDVSDAQMLHLVGAKVRIRGVSSLLLDSAGRPNGYQLFVQNPNDVVPEDSRWQGLEYSTPRRLRRWPRMHREKDSSGLPICVERFCGMAEVLWSFRTLPARSM